MDGLICRLEELGARAWPAAETVELDGWQLRWTGNVTRRANSVLTTRAVGRLMWEERVVRAEKFYRERGGPPRFQLTRASRPDGSKAASPLASNVGSVLSPRASIV